jgi:hypothetical protein
MFGVNQLWSFQYKKIFKRGFLKKNEKKLARSFNFTFRYIDDVLSLNNSRFGDFVLDMNIAEIILT